MNDDDIKLPLNRKFPFCDVNAPDTWPTEEELNDLEDSAQNHANAPSTVDDTSAGNEANVNEPTQVEAQDSSGLSLIQKSLIAAGFCFVGVIGYVVYTVTAPVKSADAHEPQQPSSRDGHMQLTTRYPAAVLPESDVVLLQTTITLPGRCGFTLTVHPPQDSSPVVSTSDTDDEASSVSTEAATPPVHQDYHNLVGVAHNDLDN